MSTPTFDLIAERLGIDDLHAWIQHHRQDGRSWAWISNAVIQQTRVRVSGEHLRRHFTPTPRPALADQPANITTEITTPSVAPSVPSSRRPLPTQILFSDTEKT